MSFNLRLPNAEYFTDLMKAVSAVVDEGTFKIDEQAMRLVSMDPAHISLVDFELPREAAEEYEASGELELTINIAELIKFLRRAKKAESLALSYEDEHRKLTITLIDTTASRERSFQLNTLEPTGGSRSASPRLTFDAKARISTKALWEAIEDADIVADSMRISIQPEQVVFTARGEMGTVQNKLSRQGALLFELEVEKEASASFSLTYLEKIVKSAKDLSDEVLLMLSTDKPIKLAFPMPAGKLEYLIAPRLEQ